MPPHAAGRPFRRNQMRPLITDAERVEVELFGFDRPTSSRRADRALEEAHGGNLFVDEIGTCRAKPITKILRVLVVLRPSALRRHHQGHVDVPYNFLDARNWKRRDRPRAVPRKISITARRGPIRVPCASGAARVHPRTDRYFMDQIRPTRVPAETPDRP